MEAEKNHKGVQVMHNFYGRYWNGGDTRVIEGKGVWLLPEAFELI